MQCFLRVLSFHSCIRLIRKSRVLDPNLERSVSDQAAVAVAPVVEFIAHDYQRKRKKNEISLLTELTVTHNPQRRRENYE